jgi:putative transcriptional regulator
MEPHGTRGNHNMMKTSYKKLWKLLIDRDMTKTDLRKAAGISSSSLAKLGKDENVTTDVLMRVCSALNVELNEIVETVRKGEADE